MKFLKRTCAILMCTLLTLSGCSRSEVPSSSESVPESSQSSSEPEEIVIPDFPVEVFDTEITEQPQKIVSLSPALTEMLFALGYGDRVYGISDYCDYPEEIGAITNCGSPLRPDLEEIEEIAPDFLLTMTPLQQEDYLELRDMDIEILEITAPSDFEDAFDLYYDLCLLMDGVATGEATGTLLTEGYRQQLSLLTDRIAEEPMILEYSAVWIIEETTPIVVEQEMFFEDILEILGLENAASDGLAEDTAPSIVLYADSIAPESLASSDLFGTWEAVVNQKLVEIPLAPFERFSPRMFDLLTSLADEIYTTAAKETEPVSSSAQS